MYTARKFTGRWFPASLNSIQETYIRVSFNSWMIHPFEIKNSVDLGVVLKETHPLLQKRFHEVVNFQKMKHSSGYRQHPYNKPRAFFSITSHTSPRRFNVSRRGNRLNISGSSGRSLSLSLMNGKRQRRLLLQDRGTGILQGGSITCYKILFE